MAQACLGLFALCQVVTAGSSAPEETTDSSAESVVTAPAPECELPVCGALGVRLWCIEGQESGHSATALNRRSGAAGWLQWLPSTARAWNVIVGDRNSEWQAAVRIAAKGAAFFRTQWVPLQLGLC